MFSISSIVSEIQVRSGNSILSPFINVSFWSWLTAELWARPQGHMTTNLREGWMHILNSILLFVTNPCLVVDVGLLLFYFLDCTVLCIFRLVILISDQSAVWIENTMWADKLIDCAVRWHNQPKGTVSRSEAAPLMIERDGRFGLVSLFNGIWMLFNAKAINLEEQQGCYLTHSLEDKEIHTIPKGVQKWTTGARARLQRFCKGRGEGTQRSGNRNGD